MVDGDRAGPIDSSPVLTRPLKVHGAKRTLVVVGSRDGRVWGFDAATGEAVWSTAAGGAVPSSPAVTAPPLPCVAVIGSDDGAAHALDCATGTPRWTAPLGSSVTGSAAIAPLGDGSIETIVGSDGGIVAGLDARTGDALWSVDLNASIPSSVTVGDGVAWIVATPDRGIGGALFAIDVRNGAILKTQALDGGAGHGPDSLQGRYTPSARPVNAAVLTSYGSTIERFWALSTWPKIDANPANTGVNAYEWRLSPGNAAVP